MIEARIRVSPVMTQSHDRAGAAQLDVARARTFARLVDRAALDRAYRYATLMLGSRADAEDATHDAALTAWRRFGDLRDLDRFDAWFGRILVNSCRDRLRARRRTPLSLDDDTSSEAPGGIRNPRITPDETEGVAIHDALATALRTLSPDHREAIVLRFYLDLTVDEIAARTGARPGTVKSRLHHALRRLRAATERDLEGTSGR
jgi:RNA polymerase sigma-70 factor, ECF subfamily